MVLRTFRDGSYEWSCEDCCAARSLEWPHRGPRNSVCKACQNKRYRKSGGEGLRERNRERMRHGREASRHRATGAPGAGQQHAKRARASITGAAAIRCPWNRVAPIPRRPPGTWRFNVIPLTGPRPQFGPDSQAKEVQELLDAHAMVPGHALQDARQGLCLDRTVERDHLMVLAIDLCGDPHMGTVLPHGLIAQPAKRPQQGSPPTLWGSFTPRAPRPGQSAGESASAGACPCRNSSRRLP